MSRAAEVALLFGGEERVFRLRIGQLRAIQERCDVGPMVLLHRYVDGSWRLDDLREVLRQGLIGGGMVVADVDRLFKTEFDDLPLGQFVPIAQAVVMAAVVGAPDEDEGSDASGEGEAGAPTTRSRAERSGSRRSTAKAQSSA